MERGRIDRFGDRQADRSGDGGRHSRMTPRWSSDSPTNQHHRFPRGAGGDSGGVAEGFTGVRFHPYRGPPDFPSVGGAGGGPGIRGGQGFRDVQGFHDGPGGFGGPQLPMGGNKRGFGSRGGSPDYGEGNRYAKLFIGSVPKTATEEDIRPMFEEHGDVVEVALIKDRRTGQQQGCCFIKYANSEQADRAIRALHNQYTLPGGTGPVQVRYADGERERLVEDKLFVASLNRRASEKEVEEIFAPYGHVEDVYLMKDEMKQSRGCGFVKFANRDMALAAMNALHGTYVMRGCDQPLIVRFADPKRPRPTDQRGGPAFGGPGFGSRSDAVIPNRQPHNFEDSGEGLMPNKGWQPLNTQSGGLPSQMNTPGFGAPTPSTGPGSFGDGAASSNGNLPNLARISSSAQQGNFNPPLAHVPTTVGQQMLPMQKPSLGPQSILPSLPLHNNQISSSNAQTPALQVPMQQLGHAQPPQSIGLNPLSQGFLPQQFPGVSGQLSVSPSLSHQNTSMQNPLGSQQQALPAVPIQQQLAASNISPQFLQQPVQQLPSQILLQQQAQTLQSSYQSSQQAIFQIQQQLQMMQQSNLSQQQNSQTVKPQSSWTGPPTTSSASASAPAGVIPSSMSAAPSHSLSAPSGAVTLTCNWTEHTSPEGFKYYYNSVTRESKWEKPEELTIFEQQQHQQKILLLQQQQQQQQQKVAAPQLMSPSHTASQIQMQAIQQVPQAQPQPQMQIRQQAQLQQLLQPSMAYQSSGVAGHQNVQELSYAQLHGPGSVTDSARVQQGMPVSQEWAWKSKPPGS
ncbi:Flowering time control protein FCA [Apostasia shenzhenica]|uniref:Flowering time control protein FCA n=1 Tax=Apostasia shenzhenica TaxID=1088818 RepID=A0A2I0ALZ0_9ASPA|nr:Flowering time control protein FCA [Apostasia shenzhenica]